MHAWAQIILSLLVVVATIAPFALAFLIFRTLIQRRDAQMLNRDDQARMRQLMDSMQRMEDRIANLETILMLDRMRSKSSNTEKESPRQ